MDSNQEQAEKLLARTTKPKLGDVDGFDTTERIALATVYALLAIGDELRNLAAEVERLGWATTDPQALAHK